MNRLFTVPIALLYPVFINYGYNLLADPKDCVDEKSSISFLMNGGEKKEECKKFNKDAYDSRKFIWLIIFSLMSFVISIVALTHLGEEYRETLLGLIIGSIALIVYQTYFNWFTLHKGVKVFMVFVALISIIITSLNVDFSKIA